MTARYKVKLRYKNNFRSSDAFFYEVLKPKKMYKRVLTETINQRPFIMVGDSKKIDLSKNTIASIDTVFQDTMDSIYRTETILITNDEEIEVEFVHNSYFLDKTILIWKTCNCPNNAAVYEATFTYLGTKD